MSTAANLHSQCIECGHIWLNSESAVCTNSACPVRTRYAVEQRDVAAAALAADMDADDGSNAALLERLSRLIPSAHPSHISMVSPLLVESYGRWQARRDAIQQKLEAERKAAAVARRRPVLIDGVDVTEHVAAMFDAIVDSVGWGSGHLSTEDIESIMIIAHLAGYDAPQVDPTSAPAELLVGVNQQRAFDSETREQIRKAWAAQVEAKARAMRGEAAG